MELEQADGLYGRRLGVWWNYPVTDYQEAKLALGPIVNLPKKEELPALFFNPMKHERLSKIALATGAEYAHDPEHYAPEDAWSRIIKKQYGELAADMELFASHSQRMENSWAHCGPQDAAALRRESLLLPSPRSSTPVTGSLASESSFSAIKGMSTSVSDFSISARLDFQ